MNNLKRKMKQSRLSQSGSPALWARAAFNGRYCWGLNGESVVIANKIPFSYILFGVSNESLAHSNLSL